MNILRESRGGEYFNNLYALMGLPADRWQKAIIKELLDNSYDGHPTGIDIAKQPYGPSGPAFVQFNKRQYFEDVVAQAEKGEDS